MRQVLEDIRSLYLGPTLRVSLSALSDPVPAYGKRPHTRVLRVIHGTATSLDRAVTRTDSGNDGLAWALHGRLRYLLPVAVHRSTATPIDVCLSRTGLSTPTARLADSYASIIEHSQL